MKKRMKTIRLLLACWGLLFTGTTMGQHGLSVNVGERHVEDSTLVTNFSIGLTSYTDTLRGVQLNGISNFADKANGLQLSGFSNISTSPLRGLQFSGITNNEATVSWNVLEGAATSFNLVMGIVPNFNPDTCTNVITVNTNEYTFTGLSPYTNYYVMVQTDCGNDVSEWTSVAGFRTACDPTTTLPFTENFDSYTGATITSVATSNLPYCWSNINAGTSTSYSGYPIIYASATYAASGSNSLRFYTYATTGSIIATWSVDSAEPVTNFSIFASYGDNQQKVKVDPSVNFSNGSIKFSVTAKLESQFVEGPLAYAKVKIKTQ